MLMRVLKKYSERSVYINLPYILNIVLLLITFPIVLANISSIDYGKLQFLLAVNGILMVFTLSNITSAVKRGIANKLEGTFLYGFLISYRLVLIVGLLFLGGFFYFSHAGDFILSYLSLIICFYIVFGFLFETSFLEYLIAKRLFKKWCIWKVIIYFLSVTLATATVYFTKSILWYAACQYGIITIISFILWMRLVIVESLVNRYKKKEIDRECFKYSLKMLPVNIFVTVSNKISHLIIGPYLGFTNLAIFSVADQLKEKFKGIIKNIHPAMYSDFVRKDRKQIIIFITKYIFKIGFIGLTISIIAFFIGVGYIKLFLPEDFQKAITYFAILSTGFPVLLISIFFQTMLDAHFRHRELRFILILSYTFRIALIIIFGYFFGIIGVCIAIAVSMWQNFILYYLMIIKVQKMRNIKNRIFKV